MFSNLATDETILHLLGERIASERLARNWTQARLAKDAGISKRTLERLESGAVASQLSSFLRVCRVLQILDRLEILFPKPTISPIAILKLERTKRKRASKPHEKKTALPLSDVYKDGSKTSGMKSGSAHVAEGPAKAWVWGEDRIATDGKAQLNSSESKAELAGTPSKRKKPRGSE